MTKTDGGYGETVSGLYPTKTRLALLADIAAGQDTRDPLVYHQTRHWWHRDGRRLDHRMAELLELARPPWAQAGPHPVLSDAKAAQLTEAGRTVLQRRRST